MKTGAIAAALIGVLTAAAGPASTHSLRPISAVLLFDVSFSMTTEPLADESRFPRAIHAVGGALQPGDRVLVGVVGKRTVFGSDFHETEMSTSSATRVAIPCALRTAYSRRTIRQNGVAGRAAFST